MIDSKALNILFDTYWSRSGWKAKAATPKADYRYAVAAGVMFPPLRHDHNQSVKWACKVGDQIDKTQVTQAFLVSLSTRRLDLRSALGSYALARHLPDHKHAPSIRYHDGTCAICGVDRESDWHDLNVLNFERFKWGGVRHLDPVFMAFDLERFLDTGALCPDKADWEILRAILATARGMPTNARLADLVKRLAKVLPSNQDERKVLLEILGYCGILQPQGHDSFLKGFVPHDDREEQDSDWNFPVCWWRGGDGVDEAAVDFWFPKLR